MRECVSTYRHAGIRFCDVHHRRIKLFFLIVCIANDRRRQCNTNSRYTKRSHFDDHLAMGIFRFTFQYIFFLLLFITSNFGAIHTRCLFVSDEIFFQISISNVAISTQSIDKHTQLLSFDDKSMMKKKQNNLIWLNFFFSSLCRQNSLSFVPRNVFLICTTFV